MLEQSNEKRVLLNTLSLVFGIFSILCIITAFFIEKPIESKSYTIPYKGGEIGPINIKNNKTVYKFDVNQKMKINNWSYITIELLDDQKNYLYAFGDEFWNEQGYDDEGRWVESDENYSTKITVNKKGKYFFKVFTEASDSTRISDIKMNVSVLKGSSLGFYWLFFLSISIGLIMNEINRRTIIKIIFK